MTTGEALWHRVSRSRRRTRAAVIVPLRVTSNVQVSALVAFAAPHRTVRRTLDAATPALRFGRHGDCEIRIGYSPLLDDGIPRVAGRLMILEGRIAVENLDEVYAFDVAVRDGHRSVVRAGELFSPGGSAFEVVVRGGRGQHVIRVLVMTTDGGAVAGSAREGTEPATNPPPALTADERAVLDAYLAPLKAGRPLHATHTEVAHSLGRSKTWVRSRAAEIYDKFFLAAVPMRDFPDDVDAVVDAAWRHGL